MKPTTLWAKLADLHLAQYLLIVLTVMIMMGTLVAGLTSATAFGAYNPHWDGTQELRSIASDTTDDVRMVTNTRQYTTIPANQTTAFIISPSASYDDQAISRLESFVSRGGTLVIAGDFGSTVNSLLEDLELRIRIDGRLVRDERRYWKGPSLPVATSINNSAVANLTQVTLNHGSVLTHTDDATVLVSTSEFAYLDTNGNAELDNTESLQHYPVVAKVPQGDGQVILVSDPSIFINSMLKREGNRAFTRYLLTDSSRVLFDYSHTMGLPILASVVVAIRHSFILQIGLVSTTALFIGIYSQESQAFPSWPLFRSSESPTVPQPSRSDLQAYLNSKHPDWDNEKINRVVESIVQNNDGSA